MLPFFSLALWLLNTLQKEMQDKQSYSHIGTSAIKISRFILCTQFCFMFSTSSKLPWVLEQLWKLLLLSINSHSLFSVVFILIHMLVCISVWQNDKSIDWGRKMVLNLTRIVWWSVSHMFLWKNATKIIGICIYKKKAVVPELKGRKLLLRWFVPLRLFAWTFISELYEECNDFHNVLKDQ